MNTSPRVGRTNLERIVVCVLFAMALLAVPLAVGTLVRAVVRAVQSPDSDRTEGVPRTEPNWNVFGLSTV